jgi:hypothetical protein
MADDRNPGQDNQEPPQRDPMEQGYETPENPRTLELPEEDSDDDQEQKPFRE